MEILQKITLDFARGTMPVTAFAKQFDKDTRTIEITPLNNGSEYTIEQGVSAKLQMTKPDKKTVLINATISSGKIRVTLSGQCLTADGTAVAEIGLYKNSTLLSSQIFYIDIQKGAYDENAAVTTANNAAARAETAYDNANIAISDANTALATAAEIVGNLQSLLEEVHYGHVIE